MPDGHQDVLLVFVINHFPLSLNYLWLAIFLFSNQVNYITLFKCLRAKDHSGEESRLTATSISDCHNDVVHVLWLEVFEGSR